MDLDNIKNKWNKISEFSEDNLPIDKEQLQKITRKNYSNSITKIALSEIIFSSVHLYLLVFFVCFNQYFETTIQQFLCYSAIGLAIVLPVLSLSNIYMFYKTGTLLDSYRDTLKQFKQQCERFKKLQYTIILLNILLLLICVILIPKVYSENLSNTQMTIAFIITCLLTVWLLFRIWKFYKKQIKRAEELLKNLNKTEPLE